MGHYKKDMKLYHSYHIKRKQEHEFLEFLQNKIPRLEYVNENFRIEEKMYDSSLEVPPIIEVLKSDTFLPKKRKQVCIETLTEINQERLIVFESVNKISFDFTIESDGKLYFFELHENQHKTLSVSRKMKIFDTNGDPILIPRYLVRLLKDIWRWKNLTNYKIIWADWFQLHSSGMLNLLEPGKKEYGFENTFQFKNLGK